jgi:hypothetical protein
MTQAPWKARSLYCPIYPQCFMMYFEYFTARKNQGFKWLNNVNKVTQLVNGRAGVTF